MKEITLQRINELWASRNQSDWDTALKYYWQNRSVKRNLEIEQYMHNLNPEAIKRLDHNEWYNFLHKYFRWKFTDPRFLPKRLANLDENDLETLGFIKEKLFALDTRDIGQGLEIATSIKGLGPAGASGLLAVLFPRWFGTADTLVVKALCKVVPLPERQQVLAMIRTDTKGKQRVSLEKKDAALLIGIMRRKASDLNALFPSADDHWTPRKVDMILWGTRDEAARCTRVT